MWFILSHFLMLILCSCSLMPAKHRVFVPWSATSVYQSKLFDQSGPEMTSWEPSPRPVMPNFLQVNEGFGPRTRRIQLMPPSLTNISMHQPYVLPSLFPICLAVVKWIFDTGCGS